MPSNLVENQMSVPKPALDLGNSISTPQRTSRLEKGMPLNAATAEGVQARMSGDLVAAYS
jgi:hypothetical protein